MAGKTSKKSAKVARSAATGRRGDKSAAKTGDAKLASTKAAKARKKAAKEQSRTTAKPVKLLAGGNPKIAKGDGDAPVQAYIAAMPGWKHDVGQRLDALIVRTVPGVRKAVNGTRHFMASRARLVAARLAGSSPSIAPRTTSKSLSSVVCCCALFPRSSRRRRKSATSTSTRMNSSTKRNSPLG